VYDPDKPYNKNQYVAWHGASAVYHSAGPSLPQQSTRVEVKKRKVAVNDVNWQLEHAREARYVLLYPTAPWNQLTNPMTL
jgi:chromatin structure-remodeling complex protein RSC7